MDIREIIYRLRAGESNAAIHRALDVDRRTVASYKTWANEQGLLEGELPSPDTFQRLVEDTLPTAAPPQNVSTVEPYREMVEKLRAGGAEIAAIHQRLSEQGYTGSYQSVWRFVRRLEPRDPDVTVRVEGEAGAEAQVDFGYAGHMTDTEGQERKTWAFVMTLSHSRHQFVYFVTDQKVSTWLDCHRRAFAYFGGVPHKVVIDNLKAAIIRACVDDPQVQHSYRECAEHYGFLISPNRPRTPRHKGKVEKGGVHYVKRNFLGGREVTSIAEANRAVREWCETTAGFRTHGTTKKQPIVVFEQVEKAALQPLPRTPFDTGTWKVLTLHRDCHVTVEGSYYSAPFSYAGQKLRVRCGLRTVRIYTMDHELIATHDRAPEPGTYCTHDDHLPGYLVYGLRLTPDACRAQAESIGTATSAVVAALLDDTPVDRLQTAGRLLKLVEPYGSARLETACQRALDYGDPAYRTVKRILATGKDLEPAPPAHRPAPPAATFVRHVRDILGHLGGHSWK